MTGPWLQDKRSGHRLLVRPTAGFGKNLTGRGPQKPLLNDATTRKSLCPGKFTPGQEQANPLLVTQGNFGKQPGLHGEDPSLDPAIADRVK